MGRAKCVREAHCRRIRAMLGFKDPPLRSPITKKRRIKNLRRVQDLRREEDLLPTPPLASLDPNHLNPRNALDDANR